MVKKMFEIATIYKKQLEAVETQLKDELMRVAITCGISINEEQLIKAITDAKSFYEEGYSDCLLENDLAPVVHGRLINERMLVGGMDEKWAYDCSYCGETIEDPTHKPNYCPNCGAKMDLKGE